MAALTEELFASTTPGLEPALEAEARALGLATKVEPGGVTLRGPAGSHLRANLWLRTASRVLLRVGTFGDQDLERSLARVSLAPYWDGRSPLRLQATTHRARASSRALEEAAGRAWSFTSSKDEGALEVQLRLQGSEGTVSIDTSGALLYLRGYRQEVGRAPLRETLAAGVLLLAGYEGEVPLLDPMCGSGTLVIEAALISLRRAPGERRAFAFERFPSHLPAQWAALKQAEREKARACAQPLFASDLHSGALGTARRNARRAEVLEHLKLERADATALLPPTSAPARGLVVANLPYGIRVGERSELGALHRQFGAALRRGFSGWRFALLTAEEKAEREVGLACDRIVELSNGGIRCRLLIGEVG